MPITDTQIRAAKPREKDWKLTDEKGLYLLVTTKGAKLWRVKFRHLGVEKKLSLGAFPEIGLKDARRLRDQGYQTVAALAPVVDDVAEARRLGCTHVWRDGWTIEA